MNIITQVINSTNMHLLEQVALLRAIEKRENKEEKLTRILEEEIDKQSKFTQNSNMDFIVAQLNIDSNTPIGYCRGKVDPIEPSIYECLGVYVRSHYRESGVGQHLLQTQEDFAHRYGHNTLMTTVSIMNSNSIAMLENRGFELGESMPGILEAIKALK